MEEIENQTISKSAEKYFKNINEHEENISALSNSVVNKADSNNYFAKCFNDSKDMELPVATSVSNGADHIECIPMPSVRSRIEFYNSIQEQECCESSKLQVAIVGNHSKSFCKNEVALEPETQKTDSMIESHPELDASLDTNDITLIGNDTSVLGLDYTLTNLNSSVSQNDDTLVNQNISTIDLSDNSFNDVDCVDSTPKKNYSGYTVSNMDHSEQLFSSSQEVLDSTVEEPKILHLNPNANDENKTHLKKHIMPTGKDLDFTSKNTDQSLRYMSLIECKSIRPFASRISLDNVLQSTKFFQQRQFNKSHHDKSKHCDVSIINKSDDKENFKKFNCDKDATIKTIVHLQDVEKTAVLLRTSREMNKDADNLVLRPNNLYQSTTVNQYQTSKDYKAVLGKRSDVMIKLVLGQSNEENKKSNATTPKVFLSKNRLETSSSPKLYAVSSKLTTHKDIQKQNQCRIKKVETLISERENDDAKVISSSPKTPNMKNAIESFLKYRDPRETSPEMCDLIHSPGDNLETSFSEEAAESSFNYNLALESDKAELESILAAQNAYNEVEQTVESGIDDISAQLMSFKIEQGAKKKRSSLCNFTPLSLKMFANHMARKIASTEIPLLKLLTNDVRRLLEFFKTSAIVQKDGCHSSIAELIVIYCKQNDRLESLNEERLKDAMYCGPYPKDPFSSHISCICRNLLSILQNNSFTQCKCFDDTKLRNSRSEITENKRLKFPDLVGSLDCNPDVIEQLQAIDIDSAKYPNLAKWKESIGQNPHGLKRKFVLKPPILKPEKVQSSFGSSKDLPNYETFKTELFPSQIFFK